jgi:hypothetical protein
MEPQKRAALEELATGLGKLEDDAFHLDLGHISYLIARARTEIQTLILQSPPMADMAPPSPNDTLSHSRA